MATTKGNEKRSTRRGFLREQFKQARADAVEAACDFDEAVQAHHITPKALDEAAERVMLAAAEVRLAARALTLHRVGAGRAA